MLLLFDEVQTGWGRTGSLMAYMGYGVKPDCVSMAKAMGGGMPIGAMCTSAKLALTFGPGAHGSTYAGNPVCCAASYAQIKEIIDNNLSDNSAKMGEYFSCLLAKLPHVKEVRGLGLMVGVETNYECGDLVSKAQEKGLLINVANGTVIRFVPPLIITREELDKVVEIIDEILP